MLAKEGIHGIELRLIPQRRSGGVTFHIIDALWIYICVSVCPFKCCNLSFRVGAEHRLPPPIIRQSNPPDDGINPISIP
ncbi:hypothetical protein ES703_88495 [subsurface metagenome]